MKNNKFSRLISVINVSVIVLAVLFSGAIISYSQLMMQDSLRQKQSAQYISALEKMFSLQAKLEGTINSSMALLKGSASYIASNPDANQQQFATFVGSLIEGYPQIRNVGAAPNLVIRLMHPLKGNEKAIGLDYRKNKFQHEAAERAMKTHKMSLAGPIHLVQGGIGFIGRVPVFIGPDKDQFWGLVSGVIDVPSVYLIAGIFDPKFGLNLKIQGIDGLGQKGRVFYGHDNELDINPISLKVSVPNGEWVLLATPKGGWISSHPDSRLYFVVTAAAVLMLMTLSFLIIYFLRRRTKDQQAIHESKHLLRVIDARNQAILNALPDLVFVLDEDGLYIEVLSNSHDLLYADTSKILGQSLHDILPQHDADKFLKVVRKAIQSGKMQIIEYRLAVPKGEAFFEGRVMAIPSMANEKNTAVFVSREITKHKQTEKHLLVAKEIAEAASKSKSEFLAIMSHELRTPLNAINGFSEMMQMELLGPLGDPKYGAYADDIHSAGKHLLQVINDVLDLSKIEAGSQNLIEENLAINEEVDEAIKLISGRAVAHNITLVMEVPNRFPLLRADHLRFKQMLLNLLTNAIKFTPEQGVVTVTASQADDNAIIIKVTDTGIGISEEDLSKAFEPFGQVDDVMVRNQEGTGLGVPLTKSLMKLHGGTLRIESELGVGTTAILIFPADRAIES